MILNLIFPAWMMFVFIPGVFVFSVIGNFVIDSSVYWFYAKRAKENIYGLWKYIVRAFILGFIADIIGMVFLMVMYESTIFRVSYFTIWDNPVEILVHMFAVFMVGVILYFVNKIQLANSAFTELEIKRIAITMAILTAPYTFLIPASVLGL